MSLAEWPKISWDHIKKCQINFPVPDTVSLSVSKPSYHIKGAREANPNLDLPGYKFFIFPPRTCGTDLPANICIFPQNRCQFQFNAWSLVPSTWSPGKGPNFNDLKNVFYYLRPLCSKMSDRHRPRRCDFGCHLYLYAFINYFLNDCGPQRWW